MSSSSAYSSPSSNSTPSSHSTPSLHSDTLLQPENNIKEHEDTLPHPKDILSKPEDVFSKPRDALLLHEDTLPHPEDILSLAQPEDVLPLHKDTVPHLADILSQPDNSTMSSSNRSQGRDVHIFNPSDPTTPIGGLILTNGVTNANLYAMVEIIVMFESEFTLQNGGNIAIAKDDNPLQPGNYYIHSVEPFNINDETPLFRTLSLGTGTRVEAFREAVRSRDRRCVITGEEVVGAHLNNWRGFQAAHIFPLAYERHWTDYNYGRWISIVPDIGGSINSVQNGLLLRTDIHQLFDFYDFSINPDNNYKIVCFSLDGKNIAGRHLDQRLLNDPQTPVDQLLRWHFRQAVLVNMKGSSEPIFEHDFPPGSDMIGSILKGPKAAERMEFELFNRIATQFKVL